MFERLFEPGRIGTLELKNRVVMPPMATHLATDDGFVSEQLVASYVERAKYGVGLVVVESAYPRTGGYSPHRLRIDDDRYIPGLRKLASAIREAGAKVLLQINSRRGRGDQIDPVSASGAPIDPSLPWIGSTGRVLTIKDIEKLVAEFAGGAARAKKAGFDGINIHGGGGHLVCEFLSPHTNKRNDKYGGSVANRARLALDFVRAVKNGAGDDYPLTFRLSVDERLEGGFLLRDGVAVCRLLEKAGVHAVDVVSGMFDTSGWATPPMCVPHGYNVPLAAEIKKAIGIPVMVGGRINDPFMAEEVLREGKADFVCLGRAFIADPEFLEKTVKGRIDDIRKCIACDDCMDRRKNVRANLVCAVNPAAGREMEFKIVPAERARKVLVVGGGPGGMEAARTAALRGHRVTVWEKSGELGGGLNVAVLPPHKEEIRKIKDYLSIQLRKLGVRVDLGKAATPESILEFHPDVVVVATGSTPCIPEIPGIKRSKVVSADDVLRLRTWVGDKIVVLGGGATGCETAEFLADMGKKVTIVEILDDIAKEVVPFAKWFLLTGLRSKGIEMLVNVKTEEITDEGMVIIDSEGKRRLLKADNVVLAAGRTSNRELFKALEGKVPELYAVGDCSGGRRIRDAIYQGATAAIKM